MLVPELKKVAYDPSRFIDVENVDEAVKIILQPMGDLSSKQRWSDEAPALMRIFERFIAPDTSVLDYGCGIGRLAKPLIQKLSCVVVGVDISPNMRALATSLVDSPMFCAMDPAVLDFLNLEFKFDAAIAVWTLQHCLDLGKAIEQLRWTVMPGGKLIVVGSHERCVPVEDGKWADDGLNVGQMITAKGFKEIERGKLDRSIAPDWMQEKTFWAAYERL